MNTHLLGSIEGPFRGGLYLATWFTGQDRPETTNRRRIGWAQV